MASLALSFLFILVLLLGLALLWTVTHFRERLGRLESKADEALDGEDLMEFHDRLSALLSELRLAGDEAVAKLDSKRATLEKELLRARDTEKKVLAMIKAIEAAGLKAATRVSQSLQEGAQAKKSSKGKSKPQPHAVVPPEPAQAVPQASSAASEETRIYARHEFKAPQPEAPVSPSANRYLRVYEMADQGAKREEIAKVCGYLPGEVDLILNLRPKNRA